jgi:hypothetical protein
MKHQTETLNMTSSVHRTDSGSWWRSKAALVMLNAIGGAAVLGSYVHGIASNPMTRGDVWGGIPGPLEPVYTISMLCAAAGYFPFTYYILARVDPLRVRIFDRFGYGLFHVLYACVLFFSALWMPLTFAMLESPSVPLWYAIRITLAIVGLASLGILAALLTLRPRESGSAHKAAVIGSIAFCIQTTLLDALVWPAFFPV